MAHTRITPPEFEIEQARQYVLQLRAQLQVLNSEEIITAQTYEVMDHTLHNILDFVNKTRHEE